MREAQRSRDLRGYLHYLNPCHHSKCEKPRLLGPLHGNILLTISENREPMKHRHFDDKSEKVVNDSVEEFVCHLSPRHMCHRLKLVVYEELRAHHDKTCKSCRNV